MLCFLLETRKTLLDHLVTMHDQYIMEITRQTHHAHEQKHRELRKRQKRAIDVMLDTTDFLLDWPDDQPLSKHDLWQQVTEVTLRSSRQDLQDFFSASKSAGMAICS
jgi:dsDNA-binding SOS-regulon protein